MYLDLCDAFIWPNTNVFDEHCFAVILEVYIEGMSSHFNICFVHAL